MYKSVFSKDFAEKIRGFAPARRDDIRKAVERVLVDPTLHSYRRPYLGPYRQEHPSDKTLTIFFALPNQPSGRVFFVWVNDDRHPHNTHKNHGPDPCIDEFKRLQAANQLENYLPDFHEGKLTVTPRAAAPSFAKFEKYGVSVHANISDDGTTRYTMAIVSFAAPLALFDHYKLFIEKLREHFIGQSMPFELRALPGDSAFRDLIQNNIDKTGWDHTQLGGVDVWSIR